MAHEEITERIIGAAMKVHSAIGPGCLESTYDVYLSYQMSIDGLHFEQQIGLPVVYEKIRLNAGYRIDFIVQNCVILELKAVEKLLPVHTAQMITYLKLSGHHVGLLINFNVPHLREGLRRVVLGHPSSGTDQKVSSVSSVSSVVNPVRTD